MKNIYKVFLFAFFLTSCIVTTTPSIDVIEEMPDNSAFIQENQDEIEMIAPDGWNTFKISDPIVLSIRNLSNNQMKFQQDYAANIYVLEDNTWTKINNNTIYPTQDDVILDPSDEIDPSKIKLLYLRVHAKVVR